MRIYLCSPVNLLHIFRILFLKNTSGRLAASANSSLLLANVLFVSVLHFLFYFIVNSHTQKPFWEIILSNIMKQLLLYVSSIANQKTSPTLRSPPTIKNKSTTIHKQATIRFYQFLR